ncbi:ATP-binding protein [Rhodothalassium salexigens]|uniref:ATP-binding protein n=1 Tax=Rhodothalassium salexigens TaxID=1086 RepID=UPI0010475034|nr:ATP-binding protein [Rhodothalassium salexigens]MBB4211710.1 PAS domain S-box-containing protein [Rhodothalassium salexigens DSM 2132]
MTQSPGRSHANGIQGLLFDALFQDMQEAAVLADPDRRIVRTNAAAEALFGYAAHELAGQRTAVLYANEDDFLEQGRRRFNPSAKPSHEGYRIAYRRKDGSTFPSETIGSTLRDETGAILGYLGIVRDLSEQSRIEACLHDLYAVSTDQQQGPTARIDAMLALGCDFFGLPLGIVSRIEDRVYTVAHVAAADPGPGVGDQFDLGQTYCWHTLAADDVVAFDHAGNSEITGHPCYRTFQLETYIGIPLLVDGVRHGTLNFSGWQPRSQPFSDSDREFMRLFARWIAFEISAQRAFRQIEAARARAEAADSTKSRFLATMSHELRTPITGVLGMIDLLETTDLQTEQAGYVRQIRECTQGLLALLNDVLDLSKIEADQLSLELVPTDVTALVRSVVATFSAAAAQKGVAIEVRAPAASLLVETDPTRLRQILLNLLSNAVKFTPHGQVTVALDLAETAAATAWLRLSVRDQGPGIPADQQEKIFEAFQQADPTVARRYGGTGLGLAISRRLARALDGDISVSSVPGQGATFSVALSVPLVDSDIAMAPAEASAQAHRAPALPEPGQTRPLRLLVAEDNSVNAMLLDAMLGRLGHRVTIVGDGVAAVEEATGLETYDAAIFDLQMPLMDGEQAARRIRAAGDPISRLPILALTADMVADCAQSCDLTPFDAFLTKPIDWQHLTATLARVVAEREAAEDGPTHAAQRPPGVHLPLLDRAQLDALAVSLGEGWVKSFVGEAAQTLADLGRAATDDAAAGRHQTATDHLHSLKGTALNLGAPRLAALADWLGRLTDGDDRPATGPDAAALRLFADTVDATVGALNDIAAPAETGSERRGHPG